MSKKNIQLLSVTLLLTFVFSVCFAASGWASELTTIIQNIINKITQLVGGICLLAIIIGGIVWMTAGADTKKVEMGKEIVTAAILGLIVVLAAGIIVNTVVNLGA